MTSFLSDYYLFEGICFGRRPVVGALPSCILKAGFHCSRFARVGGANVNGKRPLKAVCH
jgi:hypothetical protein